MYTYRLEMSTILKSRKTTRGRFLRLFILSLLILLPSLPASIFALVNFVLPDTTTHEPLHPYSWSKVHSDWNNVMLVPAGYGNIQWDRWFWVASGCLVFFCFGVGEDARRAYRAWAAAIGFGRFFPYLRSDTEQVTELIQSSTTTRGSLSSYIASEASLFPSKTTRETRKESWASDTSGMISLELPVVELSYQPKKSSDLNQTIKQSKWSSFANMPGSFAQALVGAQNLPQRPVPAASSYSSRRTDVVMETETLGVSTLGGNSNRGGDYV